MNTTANASTWLDNGCLESLENSVWEETTGDLEPTYGIDACEWVNLETGAMLLLVGSGGWRTGGEFRLLWLNPTIGRVVDISDTLDQRAQTRRYGKDPCHWQWVQMELMKVIATELIHLTPVPA